MRLRMQGNCNGCPSSAMTLKLAIEEAIHKYAPEMERIDAEEAEPEPAGPALIQLAPLDPAERLNCPAPAGGHMSAGAANGAETRLGRLAQRARAERAEAQEKCDLCGEPIPAEHRHLLDLESRGGDVHLPAVPDPVRPPGRGRRPLPADPGTAAAAGRVRAAGYRLGGAADPGGHGVLLPQHRGGAGGRVLSGADGRDRVAARARSVGIACSREPAAREPRARRRGAAGEPCPRRAGPVDRPDRRLLPAGRADPAPLARPDRRQGGLGGDRRASSTRSKRSAEQARIQPERRPAHGKPESRQAGRRSGRAFARTGNPAGQCPRQLQQAGGPPSGRPGDGPALDGINAGGGSRSTRGCPTSRRPRRAAWKPRRHRGSPRSTSHSGCAERRPCGMRPSRRSGSSSRSPPSRRMRSVGQPPGPDPDRRPPALVRPRRSRRSCRSCSASRTAGPTR